MLIVQAQRGSGGVRSRRRRRVTVGMVLYGGLMAVVGAKAYKDGFFADRVMPYLRSVSTWPRNAVRALSAKPRQLTIDIKWGDYQQLAYQRQKALEEGVLFADNQDLVPAVLRFEGEKIPVKIRLKGDGVNHLRSDKWSFRIRTRGSHAFMGMAQFSLHNPEVRNWVFEWLGQRMMAREGVVALRYEFLDVTLNGKGLGIYAVEEHFEKRLTEHNRRREGPLLRFNEDLMWHEIADQARPYPESEPNGTGDYLVSEPEGFQASRILSNEAMKALYLKSIGQLDAFQRGESSTHEVFDVPLLAKYFALVDLLGAEHGARWHNIRFYFNPVTSKLEPVSFDLFGGRPTKTLSISGMSTTSTHDPLATHEAEFHRQLFDDAEFTRAYLAELERVSQPPYLEDGLASVDDDLQTALTVLYTEFPYYEFSTGVLYRNRDYIRSVLNPHRGLQANLRSLEGGTMHLALANIQYLPLVVVGVESSLGGRFQPGAEISLSPRRPSRPVESVEGVFTGPDLPPDANAANPVVYTVLYHVLGATTIRRAEVKAYALPDPRSRDADLLRKPATLERFPFLIVDEAAKTIRVQPGKWRVAEDLVLPSGYTLQAGPGTELDLVESATILSRSRLMWMGEEEAPIVIGSSDGTGQGMTVLQAGGPSELRHVHFDSLTNPSRSGWKLTGAVTFYESPASFDYCDFANNQSEDCLNVIRMAARLTDCTFRNTKFDAFDADFGEVVMTDTTFVKIGNDGVDVSGSVLRLENVTVDGARDKGLSIGEGSRATGRNLVVRGARIGLASKDLSEFQADDVDLQDCKIGPTVLQKKPEYGGGVLHVHRLKMAGVEMPYLVEEGSTLTVEGSAVAPTTQDAKEIVYGANSPFPISKFVH